MRACFRLARNLGFYDQMLPECPRRSVPTLLEAVPAWLKRGPDRKSELYRQRAIFADVENQRKKSRTKRANEAKKQEERRGKILAEKDRLTRLIEWRTRCDGRLRQIGGDVMMPFIWVQAPGVGWLREDV